MRKPLRMLSASRGACEETHTVNSFIEQGDTFADEWTFVGTQTGPFRLPDGGELPPTGRRVEVRGEGPSYEGRVLGVDAQGHLVLRDSRGVLRQVMAGEIRLSD